MDQTTAGRMGLLVGRPRTWVAIVVVAVVQEERDAVQFDDLDHGGGRYHVSLVLGTGHARRVMALYQLLHARMPTGHVTDQADEIPLEAIRWLQLSAVRRHSKPLRPREDCFCRTQQV